MLFLTPALHALRQALPAARITLLAGPWSVEAVRHNPDLDAIVTCPFPGFERQPKAARPGAVPPARRDRRKLARRRLRRRSRAALRSLVGRLAGRRGRHPAPHRLRLAGDTPVSDPSAALRSDRHEVEQNATLLARSRRVPLPTWA